ncbi:DUF3592 domain-containing protein [Limnoglobus roseus]|uniref:DUF3592 domain-containing protein n=1 Tax=Limnoglobus roseus TaxID=2598579 RepID=A0A5C1AJJ3_9BACT|nr:DUF3592 domain-containing protein [Limnoglobus roseus]QEL17068.1 hypothetical protein PX52LOC_04044 [Limnoglobus roseus]
MEAPQVFGLAFMSVCGLGTLGYLEKILQRWAVLRRAIAVEGTVVRIEEEHDTEHDFSLFRPVVQYVTEAGDVEELSIAKPFKKGRWTEGDRVPLLYDPNNPKFAVMARGRWAGGIIIGTAMCLFGTCVGAVLYLYCRPPYVN